MDGTGEPIAFLHTIVEGQAQRSFGVQIGQMAGLPKSVVARAGQILGQLEAGGAAVPASPGNVETETEPEQAIQPTLNLEEHPAVPALKSLQVDCITPLDAMNKLYELVKLANQLRAFPAGPQAIHRCFRIACQWEVSGISAKSRQNLDRCFHR